MQAAQKELDAAADGERIARHELQQARAALNAVRDGASGRGAFALRSPVAGRVLKVHQPERDRGRHRHAAAGDRRHRALEIVAELLTTDALQAAPGSAVRIERWGGPTVLQGRVRRVEPAAFTKVSALGVEEQRVNVLIDITSPAAEWAALGDGYRVGVRIVTRSESAVLRVPVSAVFPLPAGAAARAARLAVFVLDGGRARLQPVTVGARNGSEAWIQQGLDAGARVLIYPPAGVGDGTRVRVRAV